MQAHEKETGRGAKAVARETSLAEGTDFAKKEGGLRVLTTAGVKKIAEALRRKREQEAPPTFEAVDVPEPPEEAPEWSPGPAPEVAVEELDPETKVYAKAMRHYFNPKLLGCEVEGKAGLINVRVRDAKFYRAGERFAVKMNDIGEWEAEAHRIAPKYR